MADEQVPVETIETRDWTRQNLHVHVDASGEQYRFVMPGAALTEDEFRRPEEKYSRLSPVLCWLSAAVCRPESASSI